MSRIQTHNLSGDRLIAQVVPYMHTTTTAPGGCQTFNILQLESQPEYHCDQHITRGDMDIFFVLFDISSKFLLYLECYLLSPKIYKKEIE